MREKIESTAKWEIADFLFVAILGTLLHFVYEWTDRNALAAMISPINESTCLLYTSPSPRDRG